MRGVGKSFPMHKSLASEGEQEGKKPATFINIFQPGEGFEQSKYTRPHQLALQLAMIEDDNDDEVDDGATAMR